MYALLSRRVLLWLAALLALPALNVQGAFNLRMKYVGTTNTPNVDLRWYGSTDYFGYRIWNASGGADIYTPNETRETLGVTDSVIPPDGNTFVVQWSIAGSGVWHDGSASVLVPRGGDSGVMEWTLAGPPAPSATFNYTNTTAQPVTLGVNTAGGTTPVTVNPGESFNLTSDQPFTVDLFSPSVGFVGGEFGVQWQSNRVGSWTGGYATNIVRTGGLPQSSASPGSANPVFPSPSNDSQNMANAIVNELRNQGVRDDKNAAANLDAQQKELGVLKSIDAHASNSLAALRTITNQLGAANTNTPGTNGMEAGALSNALDASNRVETAMASVRGKAQDFFNAANAQNTEFSGGGSFWVGSVGGVTVNLNPLQDPMISGAAAFIRSLTLWLLVMAFLAVGFSYVFKASAAISTGIAAGDTTIIEILQEFVAAIKTRGAYIAAKLVVVGVVIGLIVAIPVGLVALLVSHYGGFVGLLTSPFVTASPQIAQALWLLDAVFPINAFVSGILWTQGIRLLCMVQMFVGAFMSRMGV